MHVGLVTQSYYPILGGVTEHVWHFGRELQKRGHRVTVITGSHPLPDDRGLRTIRLGRQVPLMTNGAHIFVTWGLGLGKKLQSLEQQERFDIVHVQSPLDPWLPFIAAKTMHSPLVGTFHTYRPSNLLWRIWPAAFRRAGQRLKKQIAVSASAAELVQSYFPEFRPQVIPNGIDVRRFSPDRDPWPKYDDGVFTILFVGRMDPRKGAKYLFAALPFLEKELPSYRLLVVGKGWMKNYYSKYIPVGLGRRVEFAGFASPEELPRYYRSADVYCSPATGQESFCIVLLEAMASEIPIVASDINGYRHVMTHGRQGLFVPPRDPKKLAEQIIRLARNPKLAARLGQHGRQTALSYDWAAITDRVVQLYDQIR